MSRKGGIPGLGGLGGLGGGGMQGMIMKQFQKLQEDQERIATELEEMRVEASAGGGVVTATVSGHGHLVALKIDPDAVDPEDVEMLEDLVVAAVREAQVQSDKAKEEKTASLMSGLPKIPGITM